MRALLLLVLLLTVPAAGCAGSEEIEAPGDGGPGDDLGSSVVAPSEATFRSVVQPFFEAGTCAAGGACHATSAGGGGFVLVTDGPADADVTANYHQALCDDRLTQYGASPDGRLLDYFCSGPGDANAGHSGRTATDAVCQALYDWAAEGSGQAPPCS